MTIVAASKNDRIIAALVASGMSQEEAVAFIKPVPRAARKLEDMEGKQLVGIAVAAAKRIGAGLAGMTEAEVLSPAGSKAANKCQTAEDQGIVIGTLEAELAAGTLAKVRIGKKGGQSPTSAVVNLMWLKAMTAKVDA